MAGSGVPVDRTAPQVPLPERSSGVPGGSGAERFGASEATGPARSRASDNRPASVPFSADRTLTTAPGPPDAERIRGVQRALARLGYDPGSADGLMGPRTRAAIRAFQSASGLSADGRLTPELEREMRSAATAKGS